MAAAVLLDKTILSLIQQDQYGVYEDIRERFVEAHYMVKFELSRGSDNPGLYTLPPTFRELSMVTKDPDTGCISLRSDDLCLHEGHRDPRFPLHLAIFEGNLNAVQRILGCRRDLASMDALFCAVRHNQHALVDFFVRSLDSIPELCRLPTVDAQSISFRNFHLIDVAATFADLIILRILHDHRVGDATVAAVDAAAAAGNLEMVQFLLSNRQEGGSSDAIIRAAGNGHLAIIQYLTEQCPTLTTTTAAMDQAASNGHLEVVKYLHEHRTEGCTEAAMDRAARGGHLAVVEFLHRHRTEGCTTRAMNEASAKGHLEVVKFLHFNRQEGYTQNAVDSAAFWGHADVLEFLTTYRTEGKTLKSWTRNIIQANLDVLKLLYKLNGTFGSVDFSVNVENLEIIEFLHEIGHPMANLCPASVAVVQFFHDHAIPLTDKHVVYAARDGRLDVVKLFDQLNAPFTTEVVDSAASGGHFEIVKYLKEHRQEGCTTVAMDEAIYVNPPELALEIVKYLHENFSAGGTTRALDSAAELGRLEIVKFLTEKTAFGCTTQAMDSAAANGYFDVVQYLNDHRSEGCTTEAIDQAAARGYLPIVEYLASHRDEGWTDYSLEEAVRLGTTFVVQFLCEHQAKSTYSKATVESLLAECAGKFDYDNVWEAISSILAQRLQSMEE
ncbi:hypothetical protein AeMF1_013546 [Aphanomyces euteiches]|nr:hypothetical protein AeMF1_013546 [Aphanomyces euteiches]KAH9186694.1 hypothetical protein AeNC1_011327 [Aphanomyces euteiches]